MYTETGADAGVDSEWRESHLKHIRLEFDPISGFLGSSLLHRRGVGALGLFQFV